MSEPLHAPAVDPEDDTLERSCPLCVARARVDAAVVRAGVRSLTIMVEYRRPALGTSALEHVRLVARFVDREPVLGAGHSREEAIVDALERAGRAG